MCEALKIKWDSFWYNFTWDDYVGYLNGSIAKASFFVPILGYAVLFNDYVTDQLTFKNLTDEISPTLFLEPQQRLRLLFFGTLFLAVANVIFRIARPYALRIGDTSEKYADHFLTYAPAHVFWQLHMDIKRSDFDPWTPEGKYYDDDWNLFWMEAKWQKSGKNLIAENTNVEGLPEYSRVDYEEAKKRHRSVLLSILRETYFRETRQRRPYLVLSIAIASIGYALLLIPSIDLTGRVIQLTFLA